MKKRMYDVSVLLPLLLLLSSLCLPLTSTASPLPAAVPGAEKAAQDLDPRDILMKYYRALGGLDKLKARKSSYSEADFLINGVKGVLKTWTLGSGFSRQELEIMGSNNISGGNNTASWSIDQNGKVLEKKDPATVKNRKLRKLMREYRFMDPKSTDFILTYKGTEKVDEYTCHVVEIANRINRNLSTWYIDTVTYLQRGQVDSGPEGESLQFYSQYRAINDGVKEAFRADFTRKPSNQAFSIVVRKFEANVPLQPSFFDIPEDVRDFHFLKGNSSENIPFQYIADHIMVTAVINGSEGLWELDSGADVSVIGLEYARSLGLKPEGTVKGTGLAKVVEFSPVSIPGLTVQGVRMDKQRVLAAGFIAEIGERAGMELKGILGYDFLSRFTVKIDYAAKTMSLYDPASFEYRGKGKVLEAPLANRSFTLHMTVDGTYSGPWRVDLGSGGMDFHYPFAMANNLLKHKGIETITIGAGGSIKSRRVRFSKLEVAGFTLHNPIIDFSLQPGEGSFMDKALIGNVGNWVFRNFVLYLDYKNQRLVLEKGADFGRVFPEDHSGLGIMHTAGGAVQVEFITPGSPAQEAGFRVGDLLKTINGKPYKSYGTVLDVWELFKKAPGTRYDITVSREGKMVEMNLTLRDLFM